MSKLILTGLETSDKKDKKMILPFSRVLVHGHRLKYSSFHRSLCSWSGSVGSGGDRPSWSEEWKILGLGASLVDGEDSTTISNLLFVQVGFGVDQHGSNDATKASIRAVRNAIEFNSIPGVIEAIPGGRAEMLIHVKLGVPESLPVRTIEVAKVFPYGKLLPIDVVEGGLSFPTGRVVEELGDQDDLAVCVAACVSVGYNDGSATSTHKTYSTKDGY